MKKIDKDKNGGGGADDVLPQMVREYIIHDRGNSLFLSDSFGNLPSPVNESKTIKNLFKNKDDDDLNKPEKKKGSDNKKKDIIVEGKDPNSDGEDDDDSKSQVEIDVHELDKVVFKDNYKKDVVFK